MDRGEEGSWERIEKKRKSPWGKREMQWNYVHQMQHQPKSSLSSSWSDKGQQTLFGTHFISSRQNNQWIKVISFTQTSTLKLQKPNWLSWALVALSCLFTITNVGMNLRQNMGQQDLIGFKRFIKGTKSSYYYSLYCMSPTSVRLCYVSVKSLGDLRGLYASSEVLFGRSLDGFRQHSPSRVGLFNLSM